MPVEAIHEALSTEFGLTAAEKKLRRSGQPHYKVEIRWARQDLVDEGILAKLEEAGRGHWQIAGNRLREADSRADEIATSLTVAEGATQSVLVNRFERSAVARKACLASHGHRCKVCSFDFASTYGEIGRDAIHVHHTTPLASIGHEYQLDPVRDLVPVCPNCHHMLHRREPPFTVMELQAILRAAADGEAY